MPISRPIGGAPPIAPEDPVRPHGYVPPEQHVLPSTRPKAKSGDKPKADQDLWTFKYSGASGANGSVVAFPVIELPKPRPLTVQFYQDTALRAPEQTLGIETLATLQYDSSQVDADPADGDFRLIDLGGGSFVLVSYTHFSPTLPLTGPGTEIQLSNITGQARFAINAVDTSNPTHERVELTLIVESPAGVLTMAPGTTCLFSRLLFTPAYDVIPNAGVRARVTYSAGSAEDIQFLCDWSGALQLMASRVLIERVTVKTDGAIDFQAQPVKIAAIVLAGGDRPGTLPTLTELTEAVPVDETYRLIVPSLARRVSLIALYGNEGAPGDAPLGEFFIAFISSAGNAIAYIDAMSAREALFGAGLPIPNGTREIGLSNRSDDASVRLGAVWHLGV
jgi:hypothetical protein